MRFRLALLLVAAAAPPALAQRSFVIERFDAAIRVDPSGDLHVAESITARFSGSWNGIIRAIPVEYRTPQGFNWTLGLSLESVTGADQQPLKVETTREGHYLKYKIWIPGAQDATRTFELRYRARNGLRFFENHDELYWNVTGDEWDVPIEAASARIILPEGTSNIRANAFTGAYGSRAQDADTDVAGNGVEVRTRAPLRLHEGITVAVALDKGFVHEPTAADKLSLFFRSNWPLFLPIVIFAVMFYLWWTRGRDPRLRPIAARYEPP